MSQKIVIISSGGGNLLNVQRALNFCGNSATISSSIEAIEAADKLVIPGVGAFNKCISGLKKDHLLDSIVSAAQQGKPILGICVGMQILFEVGEEYGNHEGLGLIPGKVVAIKKAFAFNNPEHKVPHIGWYPLKKNTNYPIEKYDPLQVKENAYVYFIHSYMCQPIKNEYIKAYYDFEKHKIPAIVQNKNIYGIQFHPEKSGKAGLEIIKSFVELA